MHNAPGCQTASDLRTRLAGLSPWIAGITAKLAAGRAEGAYAIPRAAGGYARPAFYAAGGMRRMSAGRAEMVPARQPRIIGDRMRGDEAFIPIDGSARSLGILGMAAQRMGQSLIPAGAMARSSAGAGGASAQSSAPATAGTVIHVGVQNIHVAGNLDPTNSTAWRATMERLRQELRSVERSYR